MTSYKHNESIALIIRVANKEYLRFQNARLQGVYSVETG